MTKSPPRLSRRPSRRDGFAGGIRVANELGPGAIRTEALDSFWRFVAERQRIWCRRFVERRAPPWTTDPILQSNRFTNVYRELDPGTQYALKWILEGRESAQDRVFNIMIYRLIGRAETHRRLGILRLQDYEGAKFESVLRGIRSEGGAPFTSAYLVSGYSSYGGADKIANVATIFEELRRHFDPFWDKLHTSESMEEAFSVVSGMDGFGSFLSYQVMVDLTYPLKVEGGRGLLRVDPEEWARAGPGATRGLRLLGSSQKTDLSTMKWLASSQASEFERLNVQFPFLRDEAGRRVPISLPNIQNCLCEFYKYSKIRTGDGRARRRFQPYHSNSAMSPREAAS